MEGAAPPLASVASTFAVMDGVPLREAVDGAAVGVLAAVMWLVLPHDWWSGLCGFGMGFLSITGVRNRLTDCSMRVFDWAV